MTQLEKEQAEDEDVYEKMQCWCETNDKEKTQAIEDAEQHIQDLTSAIEELTGASARLGAEIKNLESEVASNQESLDQATAIRQKQLAEFNAEEKDLLQSIKALDSAIVVLSKHHSALMQMPRTRMLSIASTVQHEMQKHASLLEGLFTQSQRETMQNFVQAPEDYFDALLQAPSYAPQSGEIFGILKQMKETFEADLSSSQKDENDSQSSFEELKSAKEEEIGAGQRQIDTKTQELATTDVKLAESKQDKEDTKASLSADEQFLMTLKEKCSMTDKEWEERQKTRQEEMVAVSKALEILSSDESHDLFTRTFNPAFIQTDAHSDRRAQAAALLSKVAKAVHNPRLANLAMRVRLDAFERVKKAIDDMVAELTKQKEDEIKHKDFCVDELNQNQVQTERKDREKADFIAQIDDLEMTIDQLTKAIAGLKAEIAEMQVQLKRAGEDREKQNKEFQSTVADQRETQKLLQAALGVLRKVYDPSAFVQFEKKQEPAGPPPPAGFETYKKSEASGGVLSMIQQVIDDAKAMETEVVRAEEDSQKAYEDFVKETNASIGSKKIDIVNKSENKANAEIAHVKAKDGKESTLVELQQLSNYNSELHGSCDFVTKNFELRQTARDEEVEALKQAKAILSGANFGNFLQMA